MAGEHLMCDMAIEKLRAQLTRAEKVIEVLRPHSRYRAPSGFCCHLCRAHWKLNKTERHHSYCPLAECGRPAALLDGRDGDG